MRKAKMSAAKKKLKEPCGWSLVRCDVSEYAAEPGQKSKQKCLKPAKKVNTYNENDKNTRHK